MNFTKIIVELAEQWVAADKALAQQATDEYGALFPSVFSYQKSGVSHVMVKLAHIAKRYCQLKGMSGILESDDEDGAN